MIKRQIFILSIFLSTIFLSCTDNVRKEELQISQKSFLASIESFNEANETVSKMIQNYEPEQTGNQEKVILQIKKGLTESEVVTDSYLDFMHPQMKTMYRENLIGSFKLLVRNNNNSELESDIEKQFNSRQQLFWTFMETNHNDLNLKIKQVNEKTFIQKIKKFVSANKNKKSYWRMFLRFLISDFVAITIFSFLIMALVLPFAPIGLLFEKFNKGLLNVLSIPFLVIAGIVQAYFWILWAAYCVFTIHFYMDSPSVSYNWLYYLTGFFSVTGPIGFISNKESQSVNAYEEQKKIKSGTLYYSLIAIVAFLVFCIWADMLEFKYIAWLKEWFY